MTDVDMETVSWLVASEYRMKTCESLSDSMGTPTGVADDVGKDIAHVSRAIQEMRGRGLVELLSDDDQKKGRIYTLTETGEAAYAKADTVKA